MLHSSKLIHLDAKNISPFIDNVMHSSVSLIPAPRNNRKLFKKQGFFVMFWFAVTSNPTRILNESIFRSKFSFINPYLLHPFLKFYKKEQYFCCTGLLHGSNLIHLDDRNMAHITWNLMHNSVNLISASKSKKEFLKPATIKKWKTFIWVICWLRISIQSKL